MQIIGTNVEKMSPLNKSFFNPYRKKYDTIFLVTLLRGRKEQL